MKKILLVTIILVMMMSITTYADGESGSIVSSGHGSTFVIKNDGSLWGWGMRYTGGGTGHRDPVTSPIKVLDNVRSVSANTFTTIAVKKDNTLWGWGSFDGYLNEDQDPIFLTPVKILDDVKIAACGDDYILAIKNDNTLWMCGDMYVGDGTTTKADTNSSFIKVMDNVKSCFAGSATVFVIKEDDTLWGWGDNSEAQLGNMTDDGDTSTDAELTATKILDDVKLVSEGGGMVLAIRLDGSLYSWGSDKIYTENGWVKNPGSPYKVMDNVVTATMCQNGSGVLVVKTDGTLWGWDGQWNNEGDRQTPYKYADNVSYVSNGERHAAVVKKDNTLWTMGGNYRYGLGYDSKEVWYTPLTKILENIQDAPASWAVQEVEKAIGMQLIPEDMQGDYYKAITREEFCILAIKMIEIKSNMNIENYITARGLEMSSDSPFTDCSNKNVMAASVLNIVNGTSDTTFDPDSQLTREQAAKVLSTTARAIGEDITAQPPSYADLSDIADWAKPFTGYLYNINVMKGVGANKFDPKASYQRQQAYMTMYRLFNAIDSVSMEKIEAAQEESPEIGEVGTLADIKSDISAIAMPTEFYMSIEGTTTSTEFDKVLKYDVYYKDANVRIDTYWDNAMVSYSIYNQNDDATYTEMMRYTSYGEYIKGNMLPIRLLNVEYLEQLEIDTDIEYFTANYQILNDEKVLYIKSSIRNGVTTEIWYSLKYLVPVKYYETWVEEDGTEIVSWEVIETEVGALDDEIFDIPDDAVISEQSADDYYEEQSQTGTTRDLLLYQVNYIDIEEKGINDMTQIFYYSDTEYETLVAYFKTLLKGTEGYSVSAGDEMTAIDGTLNGDTVIVIINNYKKYEPEVGKNGVNINYY